MTRLHRLYSRKLAAPRPLFDEPDAVEFSNIVIRNLYTVTQASNIDDRLAAVNIVDEIGGPSGMHDLSKPNEYPAGEEAQSQSLFPEMDFGNMRRIEGEEDEDDNKKTAKKLTPAFKNLLTEQIIPTPGFHDITFLPEEDQGIFEHDYDDPATAQKWLDGFIDSEGVFYDRYEAAMLIDHDEDMLFSEDLMPLEDQERGAVGLIEGPVMDENKYSIDYGRADSAIPRPPDKEHILYGRSRSIARKR